MKNRRNFLKKIFTGVTIAGIIPFSNEAVASEIKITNKLIHHVFFWLKEPKNIEVLRKFEKGIEELLKIETIRMSHVGVPAPTKDRAVVDHSYDYSFMVFFDNKKDHDIYQTHPIHLKFIKENSDLFEKVVVYDSVDIK